jgi:hypothetical protein
MERAKPQALPSHEADRPPQGIIAPTPARPTVGDAVRRYWPLVLLWVLVCGAYGAYYGHSRKPVYKATASLSIGLLDVTTQSVPGFAVGGEVVAAGYSRSLQTDAIIVPAARELHMTPADVRGRVSSSSVPDSPIVMITAAGSSAGEAVAVANAVSHSMIAYGRTRANSGRVFTALLQRYRGAVRDRNRARSRLDALRSAQSKTKDTTSQTAASQGTPSNSSARKPKPGEIARAKADLAGQQLRVDSLGDQYRARATAPGNTPVVQRLVDAEGASNDRNSKIQLYAGLGVLGGLCVGTALAVLIAGIRYRRRPAL